LVKILAIISLIYIESLKIDKILWLPEKNL